MPRPTITDQYGDGHFGYGILLHPDTVDDLVTQHNEHAAALDALETGGSVDYVTPEDHGAVGDGVTDDLGAIQAAITEAVTDGLMAVKLGAGKNYYISEAIRIEDVTGFHLMGGNSEIIFPSDDPGIVLEDGEHTASNLRSGVFIRNTSDCIIRDIRFRGTGTDSPSAGPGSAIYARRTVGLRVINCQHANGGSLFQQDAVADTTGQGDSLAVSGSVVTLTDAGGAFHGGMVGADIFLSGCSNQLNNGHGRVTAVTSATVLTYVMEAGQAANETSAFTYTINDGDRDTVVDSCVSRNARFYCSVAGKGHVYRNCKWEWNLEHADVAGTGDSLSVSGTTVTLTDAAGRFRPSHHGKPIKIVNATSPANNIAALLTYISPTQVSFENAAGVTERFPGDWYIMQGERVGQGAGVGALAFDGVDEVTITAASPVFKTTDVGRALHMGNATSSANERSFPISEVVSSTVAKVYNTAGVSEDFDGFFTIDSWDKIFDADAHGSDHAIYVFAGRSDVKVLGCTFTGNRATAIKNSGSASPVGPTIVDGCTFIECGEVFQFGADDNQDHTGCTFSNNFMVDCATQRPIWFSGTCVNIMGGRGIRIQNNTFLYTRDRSFDPDFDDSGLAGGSYGIRVERYASNYSQPVEDVLIAGNKFLVDLKRARRGHQLNIAIFLEHCGIRGKWGPAGFLTKDGTTMTYLAGGGTPFNAVDDIGKSIEFVNSADAANNGTFIITGVPTRDTCTFENAAGVGGFSAVGTWRMHDRSSAGPVVIEDNYFADVATICIDSSYCTMPIVRHNTFNMAGVSWRTTGDLMPMAYGNTRLGATSDAASFYFGGSTTDQMSSWPVFYDNTSPGVTPNGSARMRDFGIALSDVSSVRVDFPLLGKQGKVRPTGGYEEVVIAYGSHLVDGDFLVLNGTGGIGTNVFTYKADTPGAGQFNSMAGLIALIAAVPDIDAEDYGTNFASGALTTGHIRIRRATQDTTDENFYVFSTTLFPTALPVLSNGVGGAAYSRGCASVGPVADKTVIWSPMCSLGGTAFLTPNNADGRTALAGGPAMHVKNVEDGGACEVMQHDDILATTPEFRFLLGGV
jgi:hypothetical protein